MMKTICQIIIYVVLIALLWGCRERYYHDYIMPESGFLIVNGFINARGNPSVIRLSRSNKLFESPAEIMEQGASVFIESSDNEKFPVFETSPGVYTSASFPISASSRYRVHITAKGKEYVSEYTASRATPDIDSISWEQENDGVHFYVHAHDDTNSSRYFRWKFEETWETNAPFVTTLQYDRGPDNTLTGVKYRYPDGRADTTIQRCWTTADSKTLMIGSTEKLSQSVIFQPFYFVGAGSVKMAVEYSILLKQYSLSEQAYNFMVMMKKNSEQLGSVFDPQPSQLAGNISCITDPQEMAIGFIEVSEEKAKRIFIKRKDLDIWSYRNGCEIAIIANHPDSIVKYSNSLMPSTVFQQNEITGVITAFTATTPSCIDCRLSGASNVKPSFWP
ncbi:DUF4249 domain-containing protein [Niabella aquatica]